MWTKSRRCDSGHCLEVWHGTTRVWLRDSTRRGEVLSVTRGDFRALLSDVQDGRFR